MTFIKSPLNYTGGKHKLLPQLTNLFPPNVNIFIDLFTGGANVAVNIDSQKTFAFDINGRLISLFNYLKNHSYENVVSGIEEIVAHYELSDTMNKGYDFYQANSADGVGLYNKEKYLQLRKDYNESINKFPMDLQFFTLIIFGFNNQIRFNKSGGYNIPVGKRDFNNNVRENLFQFMQAMQIRDIEFHEKDFREVSIHQLGSGDFLYADPPYLITTATYNEQNGWTEEHERSLLELLDSLNYRKVKFALSNVLEKSDRKNTILENWARNYHIHDLKMNYSNSSYQKKKQTGSLEREVLITNY
ncbi:DNA adenine methylase [Neobacillus niacini]|uniref:DNA adenine methylase n=1 Tax=Neobacillus niacini TaxID=86668 RepID=UPI003B01C52E